jgi:hypothetical protein
MGGGGGVAMTPPLTTALFPSHCKKERKKERKNIYFPTTAHNFKQLMTMYLLYTVDCNNNNQRTDYRQNWVERDCWDRIKILNFTQEPHVNGRTNFKLALPYSFRKVKT